MTKYLNFFEILEQQTRFYLSYKTLVKYNKHLYRYVCDQLLNDTKLVELFTQCHLFLRPAIEFDGTHPEEIKVPDTACISSICEGLAQKTTDLCFLYNKIVSLFVAVSVGQFRKDYLTSVRREKTKSLRKRVMEKSKKTQQNIDFAFISQDSSENKLASHLKLKSECLLNTKFYMNFTKKELHLLTEAYGCKVSQRKSKEEIGSIFTQKLQQCSKIPNPEILNATTQMCTGTSEHTGDESSANISNQPQTSESTVSELSTSEDMCTSEPHTNEDVCISGSEKACLLQESTSDTIGVVEHSSSSTRTHRSLKRISKTKSTCKKKDHAKSQGGKQQQKTWQMNRIYVGCVQNQKKKMRSGYVVMYAQCGTTENVLD